LINRLISTDTTQVERWATGLNDYWPTIQSGLVELPIEINAVAERINEECKHEDEVINDHLDMLIELLQGYKVRKKKNTFFGCIILRFLFERIYVNDLKKHYKSNNELFTKQHIKINVH